MSEQSDFTIEQFYKNVLQGKLLAGKCKKCGKVHLPPRPLCDECFSNEFVWKEIPQKEASDLHDHSSGAGTVPINGSVRRGHSAT